MFDRIAKIGSFTDMNGVERRLTRALFEELVANYKQAREKAPVVFGHPATADAAQGWVSELRVNGDYLEARYEQIKPEARADLEAKKYRYKSMSYDAATNTLRHVGWLGAAAPAISGLGEIVYFAEYINTGDFMTDEELKAKEERIKELEAEIAALREELAQAQAGTDAAAVELAKYRANIVTAERLRRVDALVASGKLLPSEREKVLTMAASLGANAASFAAANGRMLSLEEQYLQDIEGRGTSELFTAFSRPMGTQSAEVSGSKLITKL